MSVTQFENSISKECVCLNGGGGGVSRAGSRLGGGYSEMRPF